MELDEIRIGTRVYLPADTRNSRGELFHHAGCHGTVIAPQVERLVGKVRVRWDNASDHSPNANSETNVDTAKLVVTPVTPCANCSEPASLDDYLCEACRNG